MTTGGSDDEPDPLGEPDGETSTSADAEAEADSSEETMSNHERAQRLKRGAMQGLQFGKHLVWELGRRRDK